jgi:lipoate-protein ligase B
VGYPLLPLAPGGLSMNGPHIPQADYVGYLRRLEAMVIAALAQFGVQGQALPGLTGVWVQPAEQERPAKIAAIGVKVDVHGISQHGFALNVDPDMSYWEGIVGCGLRDHAAISMADLLDPAPEMPAVMDAVMQSFAQVFQRTLKETATP